MTDRDHCTLLYVSQTCSSHCKHACCILSFILSIAPFWNINNTNTTDANFHARNPPHSMHRFAYCIFLCCILLKPVKRHCLHSTWSFQFNRCVYTLISILTYSKMDFPICRLDENRGAIQLHSYTRMLRLNTWFTPNRRLDRDSEHFVGFLWASFQFHTQITLWNRFQRRSQQSIQTMWF